jgi:hypothetical protein
VDQVSGGSRRVAGQVPAADAAPAGPVRCARSAAGHPECACGVLPRGCRPWPASCCAGFPAALAIPVMTGASGLFAARGDHRGRRWPSSCRRHLTAVTLCQFTRSCGARRARGLGERSWCARGSCGWPGEGDGDRGAVAGPAGDREVAVVCPDQFGDDGQSDAAACGLAGGVAAAEVTRTRPDRSSVICCRPGIRPGTSGPGDVPASTIAARWRGRPGVRARPGTRSRRAQPSRSRRGQEPGPACLGFGSTGLPGAAVFGAGRSCPGRAGRDRPACCGSPGRPGETLPRARPADRAGPALPGRTSRGLPGALPVTAGFVAAALPPPGCPSRE